VVQPVRSIDGATAAVVAAASPVDALAEPVRVWSVTSAGTARERSSSARCQSKRMAASAFTPATRVVARLWKSAYGLRAAAWRAVASCSAVTAASSTWRSSTVLEARTYPARATTHMASAPRTANGPLPPGAAAAGAPEPLPRRVALRRSGGSRLTALILCALGRRG
jgi:hypothetical protein